MRFRGVAGFLPRQTPGEVCRRLTRQRVFINLRGINFVGDKTDLEKQLPAPRRSRSKNQ